MNAAPFDIEKLEKDVGSLGMPTPTPRRLTLRTPDEIIAIQFDDSDIILGDRLVAQGQTFVIAGQGGSGKSRISLQLAGCVVAGRQFLGMMTGFKDSRWLILQTENSNRRLQSDLSRLKSWLRDDWPRFSKQVIFHTIENDDDAFVSLNSPDNQLAITESIEAASPDVIVIDPLNEFAVGDLNKDSDMRATLQVLSRICRRGNPERTIIVIHHAVTGRSGAVKATGYDRASFARNSKTLHAWARGQINLAPVDPDTNDRLIVACGKCSNGKEFQPFGIRLDTETMIYHPDESVDVKQWEKDVSGQSNREPLMTPDGVQELCKGPMTKSELAKAIQEDCGCARQVSYRYIKKAENRGTIKWNSKSGHYTSK